MSSAKNTTIHPQFGRLSPAEHVLFSLISAHGFIVKSTWQNSSNGSNEVEETMASAMWSLTRRGLVVARMLHHGKTYFMLSASSIAKLGLRTFKSEPLGESAKLRTYARLLFYTQYNSTAIKIDGDELARQLAEPSHGMPPGFFGSTSNAGFLGFLRVDAHIHTSPVRSAQVLRHDVLRLIKFASIRERLKSKQFELAWITATQARADAVMSHFQSYDRIGKAPIKTFVFSELVPLVCPMEFST